MDDVIFLMSENSEVLERSYGRDYVEGMRQNLALRASLFKCKACLSKIPHNVLFFNKKAFVFQPIALKYFHKIISIDSCKKSEKYILLIYHSTNDKIKLIKKPSLLTLHRY